MPRATTTGRTAVCLSLITAGVHGVLAAEAWSQSTTTALLLVGMAAVCLTCTPSLWRGGSLHSWMTMLGLTGVMLYAHWAFCFACGPAVHESYAGRSNLSGLALVLMAAEIAVATAAVVRLLLPTTTHRKVVPS